MIKFEYQIWIEQKNTVLAEDLLIIDSQTNETEFFYWKYRGNKPLIVKEMFEALNHEKWKLPDSNKGLKWLLKTLNKYRSKDRQFDEVYI